MGRIVELFDPNERLLERILSKENLETAWKRVKANHGASGVDGIAIEQFPDHTRPLWSGIRESLLAGTYQPSPVRRVEIPKATGGSRPLGIPTVLDRLIQQANANGHDQRLAQGSRVTICQRAVGSHSLPGNGPVISVNRPVRTRMPGGVGAGGDPPRLPD
jgi:hypothetical protein